MAVETNLDPVLQDSLENNLRKTKLQLIKKYGSRLDELEGAAIAVDISSGEVKAVAGSTKPSSYGFNRSINCLLYTSPSPRDLSTSRMPSSA